MIFYNWKGGTVSYPDLVMGTKQGGKLDVLTPIDHVLIERYAQSADATSGNWIVSSPSTGARFQFYGPDGAEVAGYWWATWKGGDSSHIVHGGFVAKK